MSPPPLISPSSVVPPAPGLPIDPPVKVALDLCISTRRPVVEPPDRTLFPYIIALHTTFGRMHDWIPHGEICFIWLSQHFPAIKPAAPMLIDSFEMAGLLFALLNPCPKHRSQTSGPSITSSSNFPFPIPYCHSNHTACLLFAPKKRSGADLFSSSTPGFLAWAAATGCECTSYVAIDSMMQKETATVDPKPPTDPSARLYRVRSERRNQSERRTNEVPPTTPGNAVKR
ncbi:hypothetical protein LX36DRAFT_174021 [Colletotrichum falcatum]|nr:hypothetical protein LX36DRAFT_174021 [Colletotrichum falcatum]